MALIKWIQHLSSLHDRLLEIEEHSQGILEFKLCIHCMSSIGIISDPFKSIEITRSHFAIIIYNLNEYEPITDDPNAGQWITLIPGYFELWKKKY